MFELRNLYWLLLFSMACSDDPEPSVELLTNNELENGFGKPEGWIELVNVTDPESSFDFEWSRDESLSGDRSLKVFLESNAASDFAGWTSTILFDANEHLGSDLELSVWIKGDISGEGVYLVIRGDDQGEQKTFESTQFAKSINGNFNWKNVKLSSPIEGGIDRYSLFLMVSGGSSGEVFFDDISLRLK